MNKLKKYTSYWACDFSDQIIIPKGKTVKFTTAWGWIPQKKTKIPFPSNLMAPDNYKPSEPIDIIFKTTEKMTIENALFLVEQKILKYIKSMGGKEIRQYFIEGIDISADKTAVHFIWGT